MTPEISTLIQLTMSLIIPYLIFSYNKQPMGIVPICTAFGYFVFQFSLSEIGDYIGDIALTMIAISLVTSTLLRLLKVGTGGR